MRYLPFILFMIFSATSLAEEKRPLACKAAQSLHESNMTPQGIQGWLRTVGSQVKTVRDFVCCMPEEYLSNYMVAHSSIAGQNGTPDSPRVIMYNSLKSKLGEEKPLRFMLSMNGGESHMAGSKSVEMAFVNSKTNETEYFDLSFEDIQKVHLSNKNPETCMNCHGDQGRAPIGGAKMIFDTFSDWPRFVGGTAECNKEEDKLQKMVSEQAIKSLHSNGQYDCLNKSILKKDKKGYTQLSDKLAAFDNAMVTPSQYQRARWVRSLPEYENYKYYLAAVGICDTSRLNEWMSPDIIRKNFSHLEVDARLKKDGPLDQVFLEAVKDEDRKNLLIREQQADMAKNQGSAHQPLQPNKSSRACLEARPQIQEQAKGWAEYAKKADKSTRYQNRDPLVLLLLDSKLRETRFNAVSPHPAARFFLEGEEYGTYFVQKSTRPGEIVHGGIVFPLDLEPYESRLRDLFEKTNEQFCIGCIRTAKQVYKPKQSIEKTCSALKELSLNALGSRSKGSPQKGQR